MRALRPGVSDIRGGKPGQTPGMVETEDLAQLRQLNLELLRQLWAGQDAVRRSVAKASSVVSVYLGNSQRTRKGLLILRPESETPGSSPVAWPILLLMRKQAQQGMGLAWDTAEAGAGTRTQAFMPR